MGFFFTFLRNFLLWQGDVPPHLVQPCYVALGQALFDIESNTTATWCPTIWIVTSRFWLWAIHIIVMSRIQTWVLRWLQSVGRLLSHSEIQYKTNANLLSEVVCTTQIYFFMCQDRYIKIIGLPKHYSSFKLFNISSIIFHK